MASICPWKFLDPLSSSSSPALAPAVQHRSFAQALKNSFDIPLSLLPRPCIVGDSISIKISEDEYRQGLESYKNNLHGRLLLSKGNVPIKINELRENLMMLWQPIGPWRMVPLGRGFYEFSFSSPEDLRCVWAAGVWNLRPGLLRLFQWSQDFNPSQQKQTHVQCWVRIYELPQEYWRPKLLFEIAGGLGTPISLDDTTKNRVFGHYAQILVDVDLSGKLHDKILVEGNG